MGSEGKTRASVLVVDDQAGLRASLCAILSRERYDCKGASCVLDALEMLEAEHFDLVLTDMKMPNGTGLDLIREISERFPQTATIMITGVDDPELAESALGYGAYGYIVKPYEVTEVLVNVSNALRRRALEAESRAHKRALGEVVRARTEDLTRALADVQKTKQHLDQANRELMVARAETIERLSVAAELRDDETGRHVKRMSAYCEALAIAAGASPARALRMRTSSAMHDVGKIGVPDSILRKPGPLSREEFEIMSRHCEIGYQILYGSSSGLLDQAASIALTHHERMNGTGYPRGLKGDEIPLVGRIAAVADVFDAVTSDRVYRPALALERAVDILKDSRGYHLDGDLVDLFIPMAEQLFNRQRQPMELGDHTSAIILQDTGEHPSPLAVESAEDRTSYLSDF